MSETKTYLVKGRACIKGRWQNITVPRKGNSPEDAIAWAQYKYHMADTLIIESVYVMVWQKGERLD